MEGIFIEIPEDEIEETMNALRWWGGETMENLAQRILTSAIKKVDEEPIIIGDDGCDVATTLTRLAMEAMFEGEE